MLGQRLAGQSHLGVDGLVVGMSVAGGDLKEVGGTPREVPPTPQAQLIAQAIGQAFAVAYSQFLRESGINPSQVGSQQSQGATGPGHLHNGDLDHFSNSENCREVSKWVPHPGPPSGPEALPRPPPTSSCLLQAALKRHL